LVRPDGEAAKPWLSTVIDDYSRAVARYFLPLKTRPRYTRPWRCASQSGAEKIRVGPALDAAGVQLPQHQLDPDTAAIIQIAGGNFRLLNRLLAQIERILEINARQEVTKIVVEAARESLLIGAGIERHRRQAHPVHLSGNRCGSLLSCSCYPQRGFNAITCRRLPDMKSFVVAALLLYAATCQGQDPITRITVKQVRIDVTVTDRHGLTVRDLREGEFHVLQDGKWMHPVHVQFVANSGAAARASGRALHSSDVRRTIVLLIDDVGMSFEDFTHAKQAMSQYLQKSMRPGDLIAVLRTTQSASYLNPFQSDPAACRLAVEHMNYNPPNGFASLYRPVFPLLRSSLSYLRRMPGRKSVVLFSDYMPLPPPDHGIDVYLSMADAALRSSARIYGIDARGLVRKNSPSAGSDNPMQQQADRARQPVDADFPPKPTAPQLELGRWMDTVNQHTPRMGDMDGLAYLAGETGGMLMENNNDLPAELKTVLDSEDGYYLVTWDPGENAFQPAHGSFADFHSISVIVVDRNDLSVRTAKGFYGVDNGNGKSAVSTRTEMQEALLSPFQDGRLDARMDSRFETENGHTYIRSDVLVAGKDIALTPYPDIQRDDCYTLGLEFLTLPQPVDTRLDTHAESEITRLKLCGSAYKQIAQNGLAVTMLHPVNRPGGYQMSMAVRNIGSERGAVGSAHQFVVVPDWLKAPAVFDLRLYAGSAPKSIPRPRLKGETDKNMSLAYRAAREEDPALRQFRTGETAHYSSQFANIEEAGAEFRISRSGEDAVVASGKGTIEAAGEVSGVFPVDNNLPPGTYDLRLFVTGKDSSGKPYMGSESIDFAVASSNVHPVADESPAQRTKTAPTHTDPEPLPPIEGEPEPQVPTFQTTVFGTTVSTRGDLEGKIYFIPPVQRLPNLSKLKPVGTIYAKSLNVPLTEFREGFPGITDRFEWFAIEYTGTFYITDPGKYYFRLRSDDGSKLFIDGKVVINLDGLGTFESVGSKNLTAGVHDIRVDYFQGPRYHLALILEVQRPGARRFQIFNTDDFVLHSDPQLSTSPSDKQVSRDCNYE
jgi:VWFA-related protein